MLRRSRRSHAFLALVIGIFVAVTSARLTGAGEQPRHIGFDCDPSQLDGLVRALCLATRFEEGRRLFEEETFGGNGRTCATCHGARTGTFSPEEAQRRLKKNPADPLFIHDGLDDGFGGTSRVTEHATVRVEIPLTSRVRLLNDPLATSVVFLRGTPTTINTPSLQSVFMYDGRDSTLEEQAHGAIQAHAQNGVEPTALQLQLIAEFQRTSPRLFSALELFAFARGGAPPILPRGRTASEKRGRAMFDDVPVTAGSTRGICATCHSGPMLDTANDFNVFGAPAGSKFFGVGVSDRNKMNLPVYEFILDGTDIVSTPDIGMILTEPLPPEFPPFIPLALLANIFKTPSLWGVRHTAPYFHDNSAKSLEELAEHYAFFFRNFLGITLTTQDEADMVAFMKLL